MASSCSTSGFGQDAISKNDIVTSGLDLFQNVTRETAMRNGTWVPINPMPQVDAQTVTFDFPYNEIDFIQLDTIYASVSYKVTNENGGDLGTVAADPVGPVNLAAHALYGSCQVSIQGIPITELENTHLGMKAYIQTLLSTNETSQNSQLKIENWEMDTAKTFNDFKNKDDAVAANKGKNLGFNKRMKEVEKSTVVHSLFKPGSDIFQSKRFLLPNTRLTVKLTRNKDEYVLNSEKNTKYKIKILDIVLWAKYIAVDPAKAAGIYSHLNTNAALYPFQKSEIKTFVFSQGLTSLKIPSAFKGALPSMALVALIHSEAIDGNYNKNPYYFENYDLKHIACRVNGQFLPHDGYRPNFSKNDFCREYKALFDIAGMSCTDSGTALTPALFKDGCSMYAFDFSPEVS